MILPWDGGGGDGGAFLHHLCLLQNIAKAR